MQSPAVPFISDIVGAQAVVDGKAKTASGVKVSGNKLIITLHAAGRGLPRPDDAAVLRGDPEEHAARPEGRRRAGLCRAVLREELDEEPDGGVRQEPELQGHATREHRPVRRHDQHRPEPELPAGSSRARPTSTQAACRPRRSPSLAPLLNKQFFTRPTAETDYLALNNSQGSLFADVAARKAMNFAIDRPAMLRARGAFAGQRDDQILAPGIAGYHDVDDLPDQGRQPRRRRSPSTPRAGRRPSTRVTQARRSFRARSSSTT